VHLSVVVNGHDPYDECQGLVTRAAPRGELPEGIDERQVLEVFIAPIHFRLLVTREDIDRAFIDRIALIAIAGCSSEGA
jgi:hypothetical protein